MSESVWFEQVDTALLDLIKDKIRINGESVNVSVRKPDEDFKIEVYPSVSIYNLYSRLDLQRYDNSQVIVSRDDETHRLVREQGAIPYNLYYQIDFWSKYQTDMNEMTRKWLSDIYRDFNLEVKDMSGKTRSCYCLLTDDLAKADFIDGENRILHSALTYRIYVELDENIRTESYMITESNTNITRR